MKAIIFDMDGLLIDSEPLWQEAEIKVFGRLGIELTKEMCEPLQGVKLIEAVEHWYNYQPWEGKTFEEVEKELIDEMKVLIKKAKILPGVHETIDYYKNNNYPMAVASSSTLDLIEIVVDMLGIRGKMAVLHSSEFEKEGKPSPDVFLSAAKKMRVKPENCLVFEDSINGVKAGKAAGMKVVAIPNPDNFDRPELEIADWKVKSLLKWLEIV